MKKEEEEKVEKNEDEKVKEKEFKPALVTCISKKRSIESPELTQATKWLKNAWGTLFCKPPTDDCSGDGVAGSTGVFTKASKYNLYKP